MLHKISKLKVRLIAATMVLVSLSSVPSTLAYHTAGARFREDGDRLLFTRQKFSTKEFVLDAAVMAPGTELGTPESVSVSEVSPDFWSTSDTTNSDESSPKSDSTDAASVPSEQDLEGRPLASLPALPLTPPLEETDVIVIDNDRYKDRGASGATKETSSWTEVKSENGKTAIVAGARFPVVLVSSHTSKNCRIGDRVEARLKADILIAERLIAQKNDRVIGHITSAHKARRLLVAQLAPKRWMRANGAIGIKFDEIITSNGEHILLTAAPARMARIIENKNEGRVLGVNHKGEIAAPLSTQLKNQGVQLAIRGAAGAGGFFSMGAVPILFGLIGAAHPEFAFLHPVGRNMPHRRLKGFGMGFLNGLPGGFIVADWILRGVESVLKPGDEFLVEFQQDFNGEASTTAQLEPQEQTKVKAEIVKPKKSRSKRK